LTLPDWWYDIWKAHGWTDEGISQLQIPCTCNLLLVPESVSGKAKLITTEKSS
jgi:hypothetical protein